MSDQFKFCILAAGEGTRNKSLRGLHKALLPVGNKPVISLIIDKVPRNTPIVVALGYLGEQIKTYLQSIHFDRIFEFINVENYSGPASGPGLSLLKCESAMQCPFIFTSVDTILDDDFLFKSVEKNWAGVSQISNTESHEYCLVDMSDGLIKKFFYGNNQNSYAFTGIAGVSDFKDFWSGLKQKKLIRGEHQVLDGLRALKTIHRFNMNWFDTGNIRSYSRTKSYYPNNLAVEKDNEAIFIDNNQVIKYFEDSSRALKRVKRSLELPKIVPKISKINNNMFSYQYIEGKCLSEIYDKNIFIKFLNNYEQNFRSTQFEKDKEFIKNCEIMYRQKTLSRIKIFDNTNLDNIKLINGIEVMPIKQLLKQVDWKMIYEKSIPSQFHGDMQPENILVLSNDKYSYIDWRESFGNDIKKGDAYYDLGKLYHALEISNSLILDGNYNFDFDSKKAEIRYVLKNNLYEFINILKEFCHKKGYDYHHVQLLGILNYLNIASLYGKFENGRYGNFLFLLGKKLLTQHLEKNNE